MNLSGCIDRKPLFKIMHTYKDVYDWLKFVSKLPDQDVFSDPWSRLTWCSEFLAMCGQLSWLPLPSEQWMMPSHSCPAVFILFYSLIAWGYAEFKLHPSGVVNTNYSGKSYWAGTQNHAGFSFPCFLIKK